MRIESTADAALASIVARDFADRAGLAPASGAALATATSELCTNVLKYAGKGWVTMRILDTDPERVEVVVEDRGPGIVDIDQAMRDHVSTGGTLGLGLPGTKRLVDSFELRSQEGAGTWVRIAKYR